jgi:hypothetical protein
VSESGFKPVSFNSNLKTIGLYAYKEKQTRPRELELEMK